MTIREKILIVEDEKSIAHFISTILTTNGYETILARTGTEAMTMLSSHCPDLVILDLGLPDMDGIEVLRSLRGWSSLPVVVVSARTHENDKVEALDPATVRFTLKKPTAGFIGRLAATTPQMICPSFVEKYGKGKQLATRACGTGPYVFESFNPNDGLRVKKNPNYRVAGLPKLDSIHWVPVIENATRAAMLRTGEAQYVSPMPLEQIAQLKLPDLLAQLLHHLSLAPRLQASAI